MPFDRFRPVHHPDVSPGPASYHDDGDEGCPDPAVYTRADLLAELRGASYKEPVDRPIFRGADLAVRNAARDAGIVWWIEERIA